jgi:hypothetical protein
MLRLKADSMRYSSLMMGGHATLALAKMARTWK